MGGHAPPRWLIGVTSAESVQFLIQLKEKKIDAPGCPSPLRKLSVAMRGSAGLPAGFRLGRGRIFRTCASSPDSRAPSFLHEIPLDVHRGRPGAAFGCPACARAQGPGVVINEIHYDEDDPTVHSEFIELHNPAGADTVDLSGWYFSDGVAMVFPAGTSPKLKGSSPEL